MTAVEAANLVDQFTPLVISIVRRWGRLYPWLEDDFASDASVRLWRSAHKHDPGRGTFAAFVRVVVTRAITTRIRTERAKHPTAFVNSSTVTDRGGQTEQTLDLIADSTLPPDIAAELADDLARLPELLATLNPTRRRIIEQRFLEGVGTAEIAAAEGVSRNRVGQQIDRSLELMRSAARK